MAKDALAILIRDHLQANRPRMWKELQEAGEANAYLEREAAKASDQMDLLMDQGTSYHLAREMALREVLLPSEKDQPNLGQTSASLNPAD